MKSESDLSAIHGLQYISFEKLFFLALINISKIKRFTEQQEVKTADGRRIKMPSCGFNQNQSLECAPSQ